LSRLRRHPPWLHGRRRQPQPRGLGCASRGPARHCRRACARLRRPRQAPPSRDGCVLPQHLGWCEGGTVGATLRTWKQIIRPPPIGHMTPRKATPYVREEKARFLLLEDPADVVGAAGAAAAAPPPTSTVRAGSTTRTDASAARAGASVACAGASAARVASVVDCPVAGAPVPAPGDGSPATGVGSGDGGAGSHLSGRTCPYLLPPLPPLPRPTTSTPLSRARRVPATSAAGTPRSSAPGAPVAAHCAPSCDRPAPALAVAPRARARGTEACVGRTARRSRALLVRNMVPTLTSR
jgi:hypothetical protein